MKIVELEMKDKVRGPGGIFGEVAGFDRDHARIKWEDGTTGRYTDEGLKLYGIVKCSPFDLVEDTIPEARR